MATKPVSSTFTHATNANFSSGPASGNPTKIGLVGGTTDGWVPGNEWTAEPSNWYMYRLGLWTGWLDAGSSAGAEDAHLVETDAAGDTVLAGLDVGGSSTRAISLSVTEGNGAGVTILATHTAAGTSGAISASIASAGNSGAAITGSTTGIGYGVDALTFGTGVALRARNVGSGGAITGEANGTGDAIVGLADNNGDGVQGTGGSVTGAGVHGLANFAAGYGVYGQSDASATTSGAGVCGEGLDDGQGVRGVGGPNSAAAPGVKGIATNTLAFGVQGISASGASSAAGGVVGQGRGDATGVYGFGSDGHGVWAESDLTSPKRSAFHIVPQNAEPTTLALGDIWLQDTAGKTSGTEQLILEKDAGEEHECMTMTSHWVKPAMINIAHEVAAQFCDDTVISFRAPYGGDVHITVHLNWSQATTANDATVVVKSYNSGDEGGGSEVVHLTQDIAPVAGGNGIPTANFSTTIDVDVSVAGYTDVLRFYKMRLDGGGADNVETYYSSIRVEGEF